MKKLLSKKGFTIVETLVAISILTIGVVGPVTAVFQGIKMADIAEDKMTAYYLAQEGMEYIRYVRDTNVLNMDGPPDPSWLEYMDLCDAGDPCDVTDPLRVVSGTNDLHDCPAIRCGIIWNNGQGRFLSNSGGGYAPFRRGIEVVPNANGREAVVTVTVTWTTKGVADSYVLEETILNWSGI